MSQGNRESRLFTKLGLKEQKFDGNISSASLFVYLSHDSVYKSQRKLVTKEMGTKIPSCSIGLFLLIDSLHALLEKQKKIRQKKFD